MFILFSVHSLFASPWQDQVQKSIKKNLSQFPVSEDHFGVWLSRGKEIASFNEKKLFIPASLSKIPTALAFFNEISMDQYFYTWIYKTGTIHDGVLKGDLYLKGGGDPCLVSESMWMMVNKLKRSGIKKIEGQVFVDESYFDSNYFPQGRQTKRVGRAYDAPVSALSFNWNSISIYVRPGLKKGEPARIHLDPALDFIKLENRLRTAAGKRAKIRLERVFRGEDIIIKVDGRIPLSSGERVFYRSVNDVALWTGRSFKAFLNQSGIHYLGTIKKKKVPDQADLLVEHEGWSMARVLAGLSKFSNNFIAEMLTKHLGKRGQEPGNIKQGLLKIRNYLKQHGWKNSEFSFVSPSGFTRHNKMRADRLGELLQASVQNFLLAPEFLSSLPISGTDGTLKGRMREIKGKVRAKTGSISGVVGLAGYMKPQDGNKVITFVFFYNGPSRYDWKVQALFDRLLWQIYHLSEV